MRSIAPIAVTAALLCAAPASAPAARQVEEPWATVNVCDTSARPNMIGIRGSMPGLTRRTAMSMRFRVQYNDKGRWRLVKTGADSGFQQVATARGGEHDAGWTFEFKPPESGGAYELRGVVQFVWKRGAKVVKRTRRFTESGHPGTAGADPADFTAATCAIA